MANTHRHRDGKKSRQKKPQEPKHPAAHEQLQAQNDADAKTARHQRVLSIFGALHGGGDAAKIARDFFSTWAAFNTLYSFSTAQREVQQIMECLRTELSEDVAAAIINECRREAEFYLDTPPGDMRYHRGHPEFRRKAAMHLKVYRNVDHSAVERVANLVAAVYQVRCNLLHGNKNPQNRRAANLIVYGEHIVETVLRKILHHYD